MISNLDLSNIYPRKFFFKFGTQILHLGAINASNRVLWQIWDMLCLVFIDPCRELAEMKPQQELWDSAI